MYEIAILLTTNFKLITFQFSPPDFLIKITEINHIRLSDTSVASDWILKCTKSQDSGRAYKNLKSSCQIKNLVSNIREIENIKKPSSCCTNTSYILEG